MPLPEFRGRGGEAPDGTYAEHGWLKIKNPKYTQAVGRQDMFQAFRERRP